VKNGKLEQARKILVKYHANGKEDDPLVEYEWQEIQEALREEEVNAQTRYVDYFKGAANRHRLLILLVVSVGTNWVGNGIISYYLSPILRTLGITSSTTQLEIIIGMNVWNRK
jgi:Sugar (and other) transporter